jgi:hypothetical protein
LVRVDHLPEASLGDRCALLYQGRTILRTGATFSYIRPAEPGSKIHEYVDPGEANTTPEVDRLASEVRGADCALVRGPSESDERDAGEQRRQVSPLVGARKTEGLSAGSSNRSDHEPIRDIIDMICLMSPA